MKNGLVVFIFALLVLASCSKDSRFTSRLGGNWKLDSKQIDSLNPDLTAIELASVWNYTLCEEVDSTCNGYSIIDGERSDFLYEVNSAATALIYYYSSEQEVVQMDRDFNVISIDTVTVVDTVSHSIVKLTSSSLSVRYVEDSVTTVLNYIKQE